MSRQQTIHLKILPASSSNPLTLAAQSFLLSREAADCTPATMAWYRQYVDALVIYLQDRGIDDPALVTADILRRYLVDLKKRELAPVTVHHHASAARTFFNYITEEGIIPNNPMARVMMPRLPKEVKPAQTAD